MADRVHRCSCGAAGDEGELVEHVVSKLADQADIGEHQWQAGDEPGQVVRARVARHRGDDTRRRLASSAGVSVEEIREVLR